MLCDLVEGWCLYPRNQRGIVTSLVERHTFFPAEQRKRGRVFRCPKGYCHIANLRLAIDGREILKGLDLNVSKGEFVGLIGPNGAGKTSLLKCLGGIHDAFRGDININGMNLKDMGSREMARHIAFMHQNTVITFPFPALEVVLMGRYPHLGALKNESAEDYRIAREYMSYTGTDMLETQPVTQCPAVSSSG